MTGEPTQKKEMVLLALAPAMNYHLKSEVSIMFHYQLCPTCYKALRVKSYLNSTSAIEVATMKIWAISNIKGSHYTLL